MKQLSVTLMMAMLLGGLPLSAGAKNKTTTKVRVSEPVEVVDDVDYVINGKTPFEGDGLVNLVNTEHAVLIVEKMKPSEMLEILSQRVKINGKAAKDGSNCQVKLYNRGSIIMPYDKDIQPLTCYTEHNFEGDAYSKYTLGASGGFMKTLTTTSLKNKIRSFKLKRGYMVTFATRDAGRGYSRCFIADDKDLEVKELPAVLDQKINSYRIFKWYDTSKVGVADASGNTAMCSALNVTSTYTWGVGSNMLPDVESVTNHIKEHWPSGADLGSATWTAHMKTNNEPINKSDPDPCGLEDILKNWEELMATGMRLCSPSSWDGSDYWNGTGFLKQFFDTIDARGWRCDIIDLHGYWKEGSFTTNVNNWANAVKRPIWISEWIWGSSWNNDGIFAVSQGSDRDNPSAATLNKNKEMVSGIVNNLNANDWVERYFYWNGERACSRIYDGGTLTPAGEMYSKINSGLAYSGKHEFIPTNPCQYGPSNFKETVVDGKITKITWRDANGEYNQLMEVQKKTDAGWVTVDNTPKQKEEAANYTYTIATPEEGVKYRVHMIDLNGKEYYTGDDKTPAVSAIRQPKALKEMADGFYHLDGRQTESSLMRPGVYIKVKDGRAGKYIVR